MSAQKAAIDGYELQRRILSEIADAVCVTDNEQHVLYWNGPAERLFHARAEAVLGRALDECCPSFCAALATQCVIPRTLAESGRWGGELMLGGGACQEIWLDASACILHSRGTPAGVLWILREITKYKRIELELQRCQKLLELHQVPQEPAQRPEELGLPEPPKRAKAGGAETVILWAEDDDNDAVLMSRAWQKVRPTEHLIRVRDGDEVIKYLSGEGNYQDREKYPLPCLLLLDIKMPHTSGTDVMRWLQRQTAFRDLPVVILTSSAAVCDIQEAARFNVKGYLVKPLDVSEWVLKVQTVTSQCR